MTSMQEKIITGARNTTLDKTKFNPVFLFQEGDAVVLGLQEQEERDVSLVLLNGDLVKFEQMDKPKNGTMDLRLQSGSDMFVSDQDEIEKTTYSWYVNKLSDWFVPDQETLQLKIDVKNEPRAFRFANTWKVENASNNPMSLCAEVATHRGQASLSAEFKNIQTGEVVTESVAFDPGFAGGRVKRQYQSIEIPMPQVDGVFEVSLILNYEGTLVGAKNVVPFLFMTGLCVRPEVGSVEKKKDVFYGDVDDTVDVWLSVEIPKDHPTDGLIKIKTGSETLLYLNDANRRMQAFFDEVYYQKRNPDIDFKTTMPFVHFVQYGWREERNPNAEFSIREYHLRHPDVEISGVNPLLHYVLEGQSSVRSLGAFDTILGEMWNQSSHAMPEGNEAAINARAQDFMVPMDILETKRLIVLLAPEHNAMSGGIYSIFSIADHMRRTRHVHGYDVIVMTRPNPQGLTYIRNSSFRNSETVYRFEQLRLFRDVQDLQLHIPEYATVEFGRHLSPELKNYLMRLDNFHVNILNQNTWLMPEAEGFRDLRRMADTIAQSVAHHAYAGQEFADRYNLPTLLLPAYTDLSSYPPSGFDDKKDVILYSDDEASYRKEVLRRIREMGTYELVKIRDITFDRYMEIATRCRFSITFGEGFDGYVAQPIYQGGIGFAVYTDEFFPNDSFKKYENFFDSEEDMIEQIVPTIRRLEADKKRYVNLNKALRKEWDALYSYDDYVARIAKVVDQKYEVFPKG